MKQFVKPPGYITFFMTSATVLLFVSVSSQPIGLFSLSADWVLEVVFFLFAGIITARPDTWPLCFCSRPAYWLSGDTSLPVTAIFQQHPGSWNQRRGNLTWHLVSVETGCFSAQVMMSLLYLHRGVNDWSQRTSSASSDTSLVPLANLTPPRRSVKLCPPLHCALSHPFILNTTKPKEAVKESSNFRFGCIGFISHGARHQSSKVIDAHVGNSSKGCITLTH